MRRTVTTSAAMHATNRLGRTLTSCVSSSMKATAVNGDRMVPPMVAPMPIAAQSPVSAAPAAFPASAPRAPPMMRSGASTPPDVPEPSARAQITPFVSRRPTSIAPTSRPVSKSSMVS